MQVLKSQKSRDFNFLLHIHFMHYYTLSNIIQTQEECKRRIYCIAAHRGYYVWFIFLSFLCFLYFLILTFVLFFSRSDCFFFQFLLFSSLESGSWCNNISIKIQVADGFPYEFGRVRKCNLYLLLSLFWFLFTIFVIIGDGSQLGILFAKLMTDGVNVTLHC